MIVEVDRRKIRTLLPHGSIMKIAEMAGVSRCAATYWFSGKLNSRKIEDAAVKLLTRLNRDRERKLKAAGLI